MVVAVVDGDGLSDGEEDVLCSREELLGENDADEDLREEPASSVEEEDGSSLENVPTLLVENIDGRDDT